MVFRPFKYSNGQLWLCMRVLVLLILAQAACLSAMTAARQDYGSAFQQVWKETKDRFYDKQMHGLDWQAIGDKYRSEALSAHNRAEFQSVVNPMLGELKASHLGYFTKDDLEFYLLPAVFHGEMDSAKVGQIGVTGDNTKNGFVVHAILDGSPAVKAGIRPGDILHEAGGEPFTTAGP